MAVRPYPISPGDVVGLVAPASPTKDPAHVDIAIAGLESLGFKVNVTSGIRKRYGFLAGSDRERASDIMKMFQSSRVRAVFCLRGGYGSARILSLLDYPVIAASRKPFIGFSDITALHLAILRKARLLVLHGPVGTTFVGGMHPFTRESLLMALTGTRGYSLMQGLGTREHKLISVHPGIAEGVLVGGNLSIIASLAGTPYLPSFKGKILFFEEIGEAPYRVDRMLSQLINAGLMRNLAGIAIGSCIPGEDPYVRRGEYHQSMEDVLRERLVTLGVPVVYGLPVGHQSLNATVPIGGKARIVAGRQSDLVVL